LKYLNNTNLLGANGEFKVRIEFSRKNRTGEVLGPNFRTSYFSKRQSGFYNKDFYLDKEKNKYTGNRMNNAALEAKNGQMAFPKDEHVKHDVMIAPSDANEATKGKFWLENESNDKMQIDSESTKNDFQIPKDSGDKENKNKNKQFDYSNEKRHYHSHSSNEKKIDKEEIYSNKIEKAF
jgi:hypothetical protein